MRSMMMIIFAPVLALLVCCGSSRPNGASNGSTQVTQEAKPDSGGDCVTLSSEYSAAYPEALLCDPARVDACTVQRPVPGPSGQSMLWVPHLGYLSPDRTEVLDDILQRFAAVGCKTGEGPGPSPHVTLCIQNPIGKFTCGGR